MKQDSSGLIPLSLTAESRTNGLQTGQKQPNKALPPAKHALSLPPRAATQEGSSLAESPALPPVHSVGSIDSSARLAGSNALAPPVSPSGKNSGASNDATPSGVPTVSAPVAKQPRGPEMSNRKAHLRENGYWIRKAHREWGNEPLTPGRAQAVAVLLRTGATLLDEAASETELKEADELHRLMLQMKAGRFNA